MDLYNVIITPKALSQLDSYIAYLLETLLNEQAARSVWQDAMDTRKELETAAGSLRYCSNRKLRALGYHLIQFRRHRYVMIYRIDRNIVYVDGIYHQLQDYENIFAGDIGERY